MTTSSNRQANSSYPTVSKDTLLSISKKTITPFPGLPSLLDVASEIFSKEPIKPENYQRFNSISDPNDVFLTPYVPNPRQQKPVIQKKRYTIPKSPFSASGFASNLSEKVWYYVDEEENTQGPFSSGDMDSWFDGGYFFNELLIRFKDQGEFTKLSEKLGKQQEYQQQQNYYNDSNPKPFGIGRNNSGSNQQGGRTFESKDKFERRTEDKPAAQGGFVRGAKREAKEELPLILSPTELPKQSSEEKIVNKVAEKPQEKVPEPEVKQQSPVIKEEVQPEKEVEAPAQQEVQEEEEEQVEEKKPQQVAPADFDDSEWVSIKKTKNKKKGKGGAKEPEPVRVEPPKPVKAVTTPQKPVEQEKSPKKEEPVQAETPKVKEEEKVAEPKSIETQAKVEPPKPLGVSYPFNQNIAPIVGGAKPKKGKAKIIANWAAGDDDEEEVTVQKELERPSTEKLSSIVDFPSLGGSIVPEKKEPVKAGAKGKGGAATKEDQQLKQDLLAIQQQQQKEEEERKHQMRIKQEEERERKLKQQQQKEEQSFTEVKPVKKEVPAVTEEDFPSLGMGAKVQEKPAPKKKPQTQAAAPVKKEEKQAAPAPKQKASPVKATNNPKYMEDFPAL